jgi:LmbE family N-acetylglucosaminyl deacetylase
MDRILVLAPHADDAEFGMGGYLCRMAREETAKAQVVIFAYGDYVRADGPRVTFEGRKAETAEAMKLLGAEHRFVEGFHENYGESSRLKLTAMVETVLEWGQPDELFVCLPSFNQDHQALFDATITALRPGRFDHIKRIWMYEYPGNSWGPEPPRGGRCYVRMGRHDLTTKLAALAAHKSQGFGTDHIQHVGMSGSQALSALRGSECSAEHAELFYLLREIY